MSNRERQTGKRAQKRQTVRRPRECLFCRKTRGLTEEHIFGDWVSNLGFKGSGRREITEVGDPGRHIVQLGGPFSMTLRIVCDDCNNVWMSAMETAAKPHLMNMFSGHGGIPLDEDAQLVLARWAFKTIAVASQIADWKTFPLDHCHELKQSDRPPEDSQIWIGSASVNLGERLRNVADISYVTTTLPATYGGRTVNVPCYSAGFRLLNVVFQVFGCQPGAFGLALESAPLHRKLRRVLLPIWPSKRSTIWWPPLSSTDLVGGVQGLGNLPVVTPSFAPLRDRRAPRA